MRCQSRRLPMKFLKFECDSELTAQACIRARSFPPRREVFGAIDLYEATTRSVEEGDAVVLATLRGKTAEFFAIGLVTRVDHHTQDHQVRWLATPGKVETPRPGLGRQQWLKWSAFKFEAAPAARYGLPQLLDELSVDEATRERRQMVLALMTSDGYTGTRLTTVPRVCDLLGRLLEDGFSVYPTGRGNDRKGTIQIQSGGLQVGYVPGDGDPPDMLVGLPVLRPGEREPRQAVLEPFGDAELLTLARKLGAEPSHLQLITHTPQQYVRITDLDTAVQAMHATAALVDRDYLPPDQAGRDASRERDERDIKRRHADNPAECLRLIKARNGQGRFREDIMEKFEGKCAVSGLSLRQALRASHVLAWSLCDNDNQRLDVDNGLLLSADLDVLFDRYLISFDSEGKLMRSPKLTDHLQHHWPLGDLRRRPSTAQLVYLRRHNEVFRRLAGLQR